MELAEKPPLTSPPPVPDRGDNNHAKFEMVIGMDLRRTVGAPEDCPPEERSDYEGCNASESLRRIWKRTGLTLLGCQISHIACQCGEGCPGTLWGVVIPKDVHHLEALIQYALLVGALKLEQTDDPTIREGLFTVEYRDELA